MISSGGILRTLYHLALFVLRLRARCFCVCPCWHCVWHPSEGMPLEAGLFSLVCLCLLASGEEAAFRCRRLCPLPTCSPFLLLPSVSHLWCFKLSNLLTMSERHSVSEDGIDVRTSMKWAQRGRGKTWCVWYRKNSQCVYIMHACAGAMLAACMRPQPTCRLLELHGQC